jgi:hypothetical protein
LEKNSVSGNTSYGDAGGIYASARTATGVSGKVTLLGNVISGNYAYDQRGGIYIQNSCYSTGVLSPVTLSSNIIENNSAYEYYGGVHVDSYSSSSTASDVILVNNIIARNKAITSGNGGLYISSGTSSGTRGDITLTNNTITGNSSVYTPSGVDVDLNNNTLNVYNNIIRGNSASSSPSDLDFYAYSNPFTANGYNNVISTVNGTWTNSGGNIDADPLFVDAAAGDYHILQTSPCLDAGLAAAPSVPKRDFEGQLRVKVDIGADEYALANLSWMILLLLGD